MEAVASGAKVIKLVNPEILSKHIRQFEDFQIFSNNAAHFSDVLNKCRENQSVRNPGRIGLGGTPYAAARIVDDVVNSLK